MTMIYLCPEGSVLVSRRYRLGCRLREPRSRPREAAWKAAREAAKPTCVELVSPRVTHYILALHGGNFLEPGAYNASINKKWTSNVFFQLQPRCPHRPALEVLSPQSCTCARWFGFKESSSKRRS
jgi:hypothetical protein